MPSPPPEPAAQLLDQQPTSQPYGASGESPPNSIPPSPTSQALGRAGVAQYPHEFNWQDGLPSAALGGVCGAVLALMPLISLLFPLWMAATGAFAVAFYRRRSHISSISAGVGARLGVLAGTIGFLPFALVVAVEFLFMARSGMMREIFSRVSTSSPDPEVQQNIQQFLAWIQTPQGAAVAVVGALVFCFVGFLVLGTIGGAIWASMTRKPEQS